MEEITQKLRKMTELRKHQRLIYEHPNRKFAKLFVDDLSEK
jgi:hypothetical protein